MNLPTIVLFVVIQIVLGVKTKNYYPFNVATSNYNVHSKIIENGSFPYVAAILKKSSFLSTGALISDMWVLTGADALFLMSETRRILRVRLGSNNYKNGGILMSVRMIQIHPYFDDFKPEYDLAMIQLSSPVQFTKKLYPISLFRDNEETKSTHYVMNYWKAYIQHKDDIRTYEMKEVFKRRLLRLSYVHPTENKTCKNYINNIEVDDENNIMCLDSSEETDFCIRATGAPIVLHYELLGIVSSWIPDDCKTSRSPALVVLTSPKNVRNWIEATLNAIEWKPKNFSLFRDSSFD